MKYLNRWMIVLIVLFASIISSAETSKSTDANNLMSLPYSDAYKLYRRLYVRYIEDPITSRPQRERQPELYEEASYFFSKNPQVRKHYEEFFEVTPHTIPTARARAKVFRDLNGLKAEWAIRLLAKEMMTDRLGQDLDNGDGPSLTSDDVINRVNNGRARDFLRSDREAASLLNDIQLRGMPVYNSKAGLDYFLESMRQWYRDNEHRLPELLVERWGDKVVLNRDMPGCREPDQPEVVKRDPVKRREVDRGMLTTDQQDEEQASEHEEDAPKITAWVLGAGVLLVALFLLYRWRTHRGSR